MLPLRAVALLAIAATAAPAPATLPDSTVETIGRLIWRNEAGGKVRALTWWNDGEDFASLGIGHFIWYPAGHPCLSPAAAGQARQCYVESFPELLAYLRSRGVALPAWLKATPHCPWKDKAAFMADFNGRRLTQLRSLLAADLIEETRFIIARRDQALPAMLAQAPASQRADVERRYRELAADPVGQYALIDYVNFKGEGTSADERRNGEGWGLLQALELMPDDARRPGDRFADGAAAALRRRVANGTPAQQAHDGRWLATWLRRVDGYRAADLASVR